MRNPLNTKFSRRIVFVILKESLQVVDGLPAEFILGKGKRAASDAMFNAMPYTHSLLSSKKALGYHAIAATPTVTMPRLKVKHFSLLNIFLLVDPLSYLL